MTIDAFEQSAASASSPPPGLGRPLLALWHDLRGRWEEAHECAQSDQGPDGAWVHAYLHRKEGDSSNAGYWYARARRPVPTMTLDEERAAIMTELLARAA